jgi:hypothetical protein
MRICYSLRFVILVAYVTLHIEINLNKRDSEIHTTFRSI